VEAPAGEGAWSCHRADSPFRKAVLRLVRGSDPEALAREVDALVLLQHPNIGLVLGLVECGDDRFLVSEVVQGTSLEAFTQGGTALPLRAALDVSLQLCDALASSHEAGVVHGELQAHHVVLGPDGRVRLTGFGLSGSLDRSLPDANGAPELAKGASPTAASDRYALGVLLFALFSGRPGASLPPSQRAALSLDPSFPEPLRWVVAALSHPEPQVRPPLAEIRAHLEDVRSTLGGQEPRLRRSHSSSGSGSLASAVAHAPGTLPSRIGRYDVVRELGRGGAGVVYEATDPELKRRVALKVLLSGTFARARDIQRFKQEAQAVARLDHEGIVQVLDIGSHLEGAWFAMEFVDGPSLIERIRAEGHLHWTEAVRIAAGVGRALEHAHAAGLLHRDVKPHNVLLEGGVTPKLADFGLAYDADAGATRLTGTGQLLGTPMYMAPEQAIGDLSALGPPTDVYALGVLLYEALTGKVPFDGPSPLAVIGRILKGEKKSPKEHEPGVPRAVEMACLKALRLDPADRYPTAAAFADDLERCLRGEPLPSAAPTVWERTRWYVRANALWLGTSALVLAAALGAAGGVWGVARFGAHRAAAERERVADQTWAASAARIHDAREAGDTAAADQLFRAFVARPEHAGTHALVRAWWSQADAAEAAGRGADRISALASAYGASADPADQHETLRLLAEAAGRERRFGLVLSAVDTLQRRAPALAALPSVRALGRQALAAHHLFAEAAATDPDRETSAGRLLHAWAGATRTQQRGNFLRPWPGGDLWVYDDGPHRSVLVQPTPELPHRADLAVPGGLYLPFATPFVLDGGAALVYRPLDGSTAVARVVDGALVAERLSEQRLGPAAATDLDGDGANELYLGLLRTLVRADRGPDGWTVSSPSPETDAANSQLADLAPVDLDGDGHPELAVAAAEWSAYDVRVVAPGPGGDLVAGPRRKLGTVIDLAPVHAADGTPSLLACKEDTYANTRVFPSDRPLGVPAGVYELAPGPRGLTATLRIPGDCRHLLTGDFDGDGLQDVAWALGRGSVVAVRRPDGGFETLWLNDLEVVGAANVDGDPAEEVFLADHQDGRRLWTLGAGSDALPAAVVVHVAAAEPPAGVDTTFADTWARAEDLVYVGQLREAADTFHELATLRFGRPEGLSALLRAADVRFADRDHEGAAALYREADAAGAPDALSAVVRSLRAARDDRGELEALQALEARGPLTPEDQAALDRLRPLGRLPTYVASFDGPLDPRWVVEDPFAVHRDRARRVLAVAATGDQVLARLPIEWDGTWLGVSVELELERTEWSSDLVIGVVARGERGGDTIGVTNRMLGGGEVLYREIGCGKEPWPVHDLRVEGTLGLPLTESAFFQPDGNVWCDITSPTRRLHQVGSTPMPRRSDRKWDLVLRSAGQRSAFATASIRRIELTGARPDPAAPDGSDTAAWLLADGEPSAVGPTSPARLRAAAAADRGDRRALVDALGALEDGRSFALDHLLHPRLDVGASPVREVLGGDWVYAFAGAWEVTLVTHPRTDDHVAAALLTQLDGLETVEPTTTEQRDALALLLVRRGAVAAARGLDGRAALERAIALDLDPRFPRVTDLGGRTLVNNGRVDLAEIATSAGDLDTAFRWLDEALAHAPAPLIVADVITSRAALAPLRSDPRWERFGDPP
jgi:serine/threonine protein kinase